MPVLRREVLTDALLLMLNTVLPFKVGDGVAPDPTSGQVSPAIPYGILYGLPGGERFGPPMGDNPEAGVIWSYQVTVVGKFRGQLEFAKDKVHAAVLGRTAGGFTNLIPIAGGSVGLRLHNGEGPMQRDGDLWTASDQFQIGTGT